MWVLLSVAWWLRVHSGMEFVLSFILLYLIPPQGGGLEGSCSFVNTLGEGKGRANMDVLRDVAGTEVPDVNEPTLIRVLDPAKVINLREIEGLSSEEPG